MSSFTEMTLGPTATDYIRACLAMGNTLARDVLAVVNLEAGAATTFLPADVDKNAASQFESGGKLGSSEGDARYMTDLEGSRYRIDPKPSTDEFAVSVIKRFLGSAERHMCLLENHLGRRSDPWVLSAKSRVIFFGEEVYYFLSPLNSDTDEIQSALTEAKTVAPATIGVFTSLPEHMEGFVETMQVNADSLSTLAGGAVGLIIGAYDGESYVLWSRHSGLAWPHASQVQ
jgi:hypothetical protein